MANRKVTTIEELARLMTGKNAALKSVVPVCKPETFTFITSRHSPNCSVEPAVAEAFIKKNEKNLKVIGLNTTSTTLYVLR